MRYLIFAAALAWLCGPAMAQVYKCAMVQHWRNSVLEGQYVGDSPSVVEGAEVTLDFNAGKITQGSMGPVSGKIFGAAGAGNIGMLSVSGRELSVFVVFPRAADPKGGVLGSVMRVDDNEYMPKGTLMSRLSCKIQ